MPPLAGYSAHAARSQLDRATLIPAFSIQVCMENGERSEVLTGRVMQRRALQVVFAGS